MATALLASQPPPNASAPDGDQADRVNELIQSNLAWARGIARRALAKLPPSVDLDDVYGPALVALWRAAAAYQPGYQMPGYAHPVPFRAWARRRVWGACLASSRRRAYREATHEALGDHIAAPADAEQGASRRQVMTLLRRARSAMTPQQRRLMALCYSRGLSIGEAGAWLGVSQSRASQIHSAALTQIRAWLAERGITRVEDCI